MDLGEDESCETNHLYIPRVAEEKVPKIGMCFDTSEEGKFFYYSYGKEGGFGIRRGTVKRKQSTGEMAYMVFLCSKEGHYVHKEKSTLSNKQRQRRLIRGGCKACMRLKLNKSGKWEVSIFREGHNHELTTPSKAHLISSYRKITPTKRCLLGQMKVANVSTSSFINVLAIKSGGYENMGCTERDIRNFERDVRRENKENDANYLLDIFKEKHDLSPSFYYAYKVDDDSKLTHCFWADGYARKAYAHFSDVIVFDTTYETNEYSLIFAPFTGINHHGQSVIFGSGLIKDEKIDSFVWLFEKWLEAMSGHAPNAIITDQDPAMRAAIGRSFPYTYHRYCMWHILKKLPEKVSPLYHKNEFRDSFLKCVWDSETPIEFESQWEEIMSAHDLKSHDWLYSLYNIRQKWIPAYSKDIFLGGMRTTQRSESMNSFFDKYLKKKNSLVEFYTHYQLGMERLRHNELVKDHDSIYSRPQLKTSFSMEKQMIKIYTFDIFSKFQQELCETMYYVPVLNREHEGLSVYVVKRSADTMSREVIYDEHIQEGSCSCKMFQSEGIPYRHILTILKNYFVEVLPSFYIRTRWTKKAKASQIFDVEGNELQGDYNTALPMKSSEISIIMSRCLHKSSNSTEAQSLLLEGLTSIEAEMDKLLLLENTSDEVRDCITILKSVNPNICPPDKSKTKGSGKRIIGDKENSILHAHKSRRLCHGCGKRGVEHDKRNCPALKGFKSSQLESQASAPTPSTQ